MFFSLNCAIVLLCIGIIYGSSVAKVKDNTIQEKFIKTNKIDALQHSIQETLEFELNARSSSVEPVKRVISNRTYFDARLDYLPSNCAIRRTPTNCAEATACTKLSGYYFIQPSQLKNQIFLAECDADTDGGVWTVIQKRLDGSIDFDRSWLEYKAGFGDIEGEYFIGLDKLHALTNYDGRQELLIEMEKESVSKYAKYDSFVIGDESQTYILKSVGSYAGTAGNMLLEHVNQTFTTKDNTIAGCAEHYAAGWWFRNTGLCLYCNLNGVFGSTKGSYGIYWRSFTGNYESLTYNKMMIRRRRY